MDDRVTLADLGETDPGYVAAAESGWAEDTCYRWAVCEPTTGELLAEVTLDPRDGRVGTRHRAGHRDAAETGAQAVSRFAAAALGLAPMRTGVVGGPASPDEDPGHPADRQD